LPAGVKPFNIVEVRFKGSRKEFFRNNDYIDLQVNDIVAVEGNPGHDIGRVSMKGELVRLQMRAQNITDDSDKVKTLYRIARPADIEKWESVKALEFDTMHKARSIALKLNLKMKLSDVEFQGDGKKATFYYTADERVDFRELIKKLAEEFRTRIEMRQIGMRQEASRLGGIGSCGRELCCSTWLTDFKIVSTSAARYQNLSLNPIKLAGQCGKLKCCLNYELDSYMEAIRDIPEPNVKLETIKGVAVHRKTDIFKRMMWYSFSDSEQGASMNSDNWIPLEVDRVKEIIAMNKQGEKPQDLLDYALFAPVEKKMDYADVVGQDSLTRMMDKKKGKKKKKKKKGNQNEQRVAEAGARKDEKSKEQHPPRKQGQHSNRPSGEKKGSDQRQQQQGVKQQQQPQRGQGNQNRGERKSPAGSPSPPSTSKDSSVSQGSGSGSSDSNSRSRNLPPRIKPNEK
jgi:cell fate regulator YaaT (PSP1 superfamily)